MQIIIAEHAGFCSGVSSAVERARLASELKDGLPTYVLGELIHNPQVIAELASKGVRTVESVSEIPEGEKCRLIIRSHGAPKSVFDILASRREIQVIDATCPFVKHEQKLVRDAFVSGKKVVIVGKKEHPEVVGVNGWCENGALILGGEWEDKVCQIPDFSEEKVVLVSQTTVDPKKNSKIIENFTKVCKKRVEIFDTICYTTSARLDEVRRLSVESDAVIVIGGRNSSNTGGLYSAAVSADPTTQVIWIEGADELKDVVFSSKIKKVAVVAGASTPTGLIKEVSKTMTEQNTSKDLTKFAAEEKAVTADVEEALAEVVGEEDIAAKEAAEKAAEAKETEAMNNVLGKQGEITMDDVMSTIRKPRQLRRGQIIKMSIVTTSEDGVVLANGMKGEIVLKKEEATLDGNFDPSAFVPGEELSVLVTSTDPLEVSYKAILMNAEEDARVAEMLSQNTLKVKIDGFNKGGLTGKLGSYSVFIPASQIRMGFVKNEDLPKYVGKELTVAILKTERKNITGSCRPIIEAERAARESQKKAFLEEFFRQIEVGQVVEGKVVRFADFGAFVNVNGFDCLVHVSDLAWTSVKKPEDVLKKDGVYEFVVLKVDAEKQRVSLGYKQLQPKPWTLAAEKYPVGAVITGKVVRIAAFGAFIEVEAGIDGLCHVSQISHEWVENPTAALKVGDDVQAKVLAINPDEEKLTLSIKALVEEPESVAAEKAARREARENANAEKNAEGDGEKRERAPRKPRAPRNPVDDEPHEYTSEGDGGASIGELLKGLDLGSATEE